MTRNFEEEYRKYADSTVPDLWGRIEAAIDEADRTTGNNIDKVVSNKESKTISITEHKKWRIKPAYITLIAAAACLFLAIGVVNFIGGAKSETASMMSESAAAPAAAMEEASDSYEETNDIADYAMAESADDAGTYEAEAEAYADEAPAMDSAPEYEEAAEADDFASMKQAERDEVSLEGATNTLNSNLNFAAEIRTGGTEAAKSDGETGEYKIICTIDDITKLINDNTMTVSVNDPLDSGFEKGDEITVTVPDGMYKELSDVLPKRSSHEYELTIVPGSEDTYELSGIEIKK